LLWSPPSQAMGFGRSGGSQLYGSRCLRSL